MHLKQNFIWKFHTRNLKFIWHSFKKIIFFISVSIQSGHDICSWHLKRLCSCLQIAINSSPSLIFFYFLNILIIRWWGDSKLQLAGVGKLNVWVLELNFAGQIINFKSLLIYLFFYWIYLFLYLFICIYLFIHWYFLYLNEFCRFY